MRKSVSFGHINISLDSIQCSLIYLALVRVPRLVISFVQETGAVCFICAFFFLLIFDYFGSFERKMMLITLSLSLHLLFAFFLSVRERSPNPPVASVSCALLTLIRPDAQLLKKGAL